MYQHCMTSAHAHGNNLHDNKLTNLLLCFVLIPIRLYVSPKHPPSAEQKKISPYKYLKDSLDVPELNKVRGSLLAKLESIAAQEGEFCI